MAKHNIIPLIEYIEVDIELQELIQVLDESIYNCIDLACARQACVSEATTGNSVYYLKSLRNVLLKCMGVHVFE
jgi:hypothetical protein